MALTARSQKGCTRLKIWPQNKYKFTNGKFLHYKNCNSVNNKELLKGVQIRQSQWLKLDLVSFNQSSDASFS